MPSDQELFAKGLATYEKVMAANYMCHREVYGLLHDVLVKEAPDGFVFADLACGTRRNPVKMAKCHLRAQSYNLDARGRCLRACRPH